MDKFQFHPAQAEVAKDNHRYKVINCGRRWGKTLLSVQEMIATAVNTRDGRIAYVAPNFQQARDIAWDDLKKFTKDIAIKINESRLEIILPSRYPKRTKDNKLVLDKHKQPIFMPSSSRIILRGWEAVESMLGQKFHLLVLDEVARYSNFDERWKTVLLPTLTDYRGKVLFTSTPLGFNHFYHLYNLENTNKDYKSFSFSSHTNPNLPIEDLLGYKDQMSADQYAQEYEAEFRKREGLVYADFSRERHTYDPSITQLPTFVETFYGIDFGYTNPSAVIVIRKDKDANYWFTDCIYETKLTNTALIEKTKQLEPQPRYVYADPAEPDRIKEFKEAGFYMKDVKKGKGSIVSGIQRLQEMFKTNRIKINKKTCLPFINELEAHVYPINSTDKNDTELPIDADNHCFVKNTMITLASGKKRKIQHVKIGDIVKTSKGIGEVLISGRTRKKEKVFKATFSDGRQLTATGDHKIYTEKGKIALDTLRYDDIIKINNKLNLSLWRKLLILIIKGLDGMGNIMRLSGELVLKTVGIGYTEKFGNSTMEKYRKDFIFTTLIRIEKTILSKILNLRTQEITCQNIQEATGKTKKEEKEVLNILTRLGILPKNGMLQKRVASGIVNMGKKFGRIKRNIKRFVKFAGKSTIPTSQKDRNIVTRIVKLEPLGKEDVYNLTVNGEHNYFANDILVSNCLDGVRYAIMGHDPSSHGRGYFNNDFTSGKEHIQNRIKQLQTTNKTKKRLFD